MNRLAALLLALMVLAMPGLRALAEDQTQAELALSGQTAPAGQAEEAPAPAGQAEEAPAQAGAPAGITELSECFGQDIARAAEALGGLSYASGDEYRDNYEGVDVALRGDGDVRLIDLKGGADRYALCGVSVGMKRDRVLALMADHSRMWDYDEETAFSIVPDASRPEASQILVVFFDDAGKVSGAWYRAAGE